MLKVITFNVPSAARSVRTAVFAEDATRVARAAEVRSQRMANSSAKVLPIAENPRPRKAEQARFLAIVVSFVLIQRRYPEAKPIERRKKPEDADAFRPSSN